MTVSDALDRLAAKIDFDPSGCWTFTGAKTYGYGSFYFNGGTTRAHRTAYELLVELIPEGLSIDHLCRNRACVNPDHLEPVTQGENCRRGQAGEVNRARQRAITRCPQGHPYSPENTLVRSCGRRRCRECGRQKRRARHAKARVNACLSM